MKYKYFLFDWDGSLADTLPIWFEGFIKVFAKHGIEVSYETIGNEVIGDWQGPERLGITNVEKFFAELEEEVLEKLNNVRLNPGALEVLKAIKAKGGKIAVVTASRKRWVKTALRNNGLRDLVDVFLGKEDVEFVKPHPEAIEKSLRLMGGKPDEALMVGDNGKDIVAGRRAGVKTGLYFPKRYEEFYKRETQLGFGAEYVIEDFGEMKGFLE
jgi:HAD superfamily hydrolase (TIGR01509 family)